MVKRVKKAMLWVMVACLAAVCFIGCSSPAPAAEESAPASEESAPAPSADEPAPSEASEPASDNAADGGGIKIGTTTVTLTMPFFVDLEKAAVETAEAYGAEIFTNSADIDPSKQTAAIEDFITMGVDGILVVGTDPAAIVPAVEEAVDAGIVVVDADMVLETDKTLCYVGSNNRAGGEMLGTYTREYIEENFGEEPCKIAVVTWLESNIQQDRLEGFVEQFSDMANVEILEAQPGYDSEESMNTVENILQANPDVDIIYATAVNSTIGTIAAVESSGKDDVKIVGFDMSEEASVGIKNGLVLGMIEQQPLLIGKTATEILLENIINGTEPPSKEVLTDTRLYDASNVDEYVVQ